MQQHILFPGSVFFLKKKISVLSRPFDWYPSRLQVICGKFQVIGIIRTSRTVGTIFDILKKLVHVILIDIF